MCEQDGFGESGESIELYNAMIDVIEAHRMTTVLEYTQVIGVIELVKQAIMDEMSTLEADIEFKDEDEDGTH